MTSVYWTDKKQMEGVTSSVVLDTDTSVTAGASITVTLFQDNERDQAGANTDAQGNSYDNSASTTLSGGTETHTLSGFDDDGSTDDWWLKIEIDGDGSDPTLASSTLNSWTISGDLVAVTESVSVTTTATVVPLVALAPGDVIEGPLTLTRSGLVSETDTADASETSTISRSSTVTTTDLSGILESSSSSTSTIVRIRGGIGGVSAVPGITSSTIQHATSTTEASESPDQLVSSLFDLSAQIEKLLSGTATAAASFSISEVLAVSEEPSVTGIIEYQTVETAPAVETAWSQHDVSFLVLEGGAGVQPEESSILVSGDTSLLDNGLASDILTVHPSGSTLSVDIAGATEDLIQPTHPVSVIQSESGDATENPSVTPTGLYFFNESGSLSEIVQLNLDTDQSVGDTGTGVEIAQSSSRAIVRSRGGSADASESSLTSLLATVSWAEHGGVTSTPRVDGLVTFIGPNEDGSGTENPTSTVVIPQSVDEIGTLDEQAGPVIATSLSDLFDRHEIFVIPTTASFRVSVRSAERINPDGTSSFVGKVSYDDDPPFGSVTNSGVNNVNLNGDDDWRR